MSDELRLSTSTTADDVVHVALVTKDVTNERTFHT